MNIEELVAVHNAVEVALKPEKGWNIDRSNKRSVVFPRQVAHWICYYYTNNTTKDIGFYFGRRGHDLVSHSIGIINSELATDHEVACKVKDVCFALPEAFKVLHPNGRYPVNKRTNRKDYSMQTKLAQPKQRPFRPKPVVVDNTPAPAPKPQRRTIKQLKQLLEKETDIFVVMEIEKEIDRAVWRKRHKPAVQHTY